MAEIDELIEQGLNLYGQGDLDGALLAWEQALVVDPENAQANSYVDYVRMNYELLTGELENNEQQVPFGLDDEPYQIEILPAEAAHLAPETQMQPRTRTADMDAGWFIDEEKSQPHRTLEMQADEPPPVSFEDQTREYQKERPNDFANVETTPGVDTAAGFATQPTHVKERDTGFVRATTRPDTSGGAGARAKRPSQVPPELKMTLRTPGDTADPYGNMELPTDDAPPANASIALSYDDPAASDSSDSGPDTRPLGSRSRMAALSPSAEELINSLPSPTPSALAASAAARAVEEDAAQRADTRDLPPTIRPPATLAEPEITASPEMPEAFQMPEPPATITRDFESQKTNAAQPKIDLNSQPTREVPPDKVPQYGREMVSAPTRDLGLRATSVDEDTGMRKAIGEGTRADVILPFDPIDARTAQILDEIDEGAPDREAKEDKTRRRITLLFERAVGWAQAHELDKAVASIDLALSEDPNSALAQKLIHRHRDTMMQVFQQFLGDLDRQPVLARPLHELANAPISPRAAFLLSRIDGALTLDELLDVSGMPRIEAYRYLCQLFLRGILR